MYWCVMWNLLFCFGGPLSCGTWNRDQCPARPTVKLKFGWILGNTSSPTIVVLVQLISSFFFYEILWSVLLKEFFFSECLVCLLFWAFGPEPCRKKKIVFLPPPLHFLYFLYFSSALISKFSIWAWKIYYLFIFYVRFELVYSDWFTKMLYSLM